MINLRKVSKSYGEKVIFRNLSYVFKKGIYLITGVSGCGKSTLLNILSKEDSSFKGSIIIEGDVFYIKDKNNLIGDLTVKDHYLLLERVNDIKVREYFPVGYLHNKKIKKLSLGERQLVILNLVLNSKEEIVIMDEPFSALSIENIQKACFLLEEHLKNKTVIISTHNKGYFVDYKEINLNNKIKCSVNEVLNINNESKKNIFSRYLKLFYIRKIIFKKMFFISSLVFTIFNYFYFNNYLEKSFSLYLSYFKKNEGVMISKYNEIDKMNKNVFYEVVKVLEEYVVDYNANYYSSLMYDEDFVIDAYYIDNGMILSSVKYMEGDFKDNDIVLGINYRDFCLNNNILNCDENYIKIQLINKSVKGFDLTVKDVIYSEENVVFSNKRFNQFYKQNEYEEYYIDVTRKNKNKMFETVNSNEYMSNFKFTLIGENEEYLRYKVEVNKYFDKLIQYEDYIVCLSKGYNCLDYLKHFQTLVAIDEFEEIEKIDLKLIKEKIPVDEIIISSGLSEELNKTKGDILEFYFDYDGAYKKINLIINNVIVDDSLCLFHNSSWSYEFFDKLVVFDKEDLRIENIIIYEEIKEGDYKSDDAYKKMVLDFKVMLKDMKLYVYCINACVNLISIIILIVIEIYQNKFKKEYYKYLKMINVDV